MNEVRKHIQLDLESWLILQELKARLRCRSYSEVFRMLERILLEPLRRGQDIQAIQHALCESHKPLRIIETLKEARPHSEPSENELPSYLKNNPWLEILSRRGRDVQT